MRADLSKADVLKHVVHDVFHFIFWDGVRMFEVFSALNLLSWGIVFMISPELLLRDSYAGFDLLSARSWEIIFIGVALLQIAGMVWRGPFSGELRFVAMALAAGAWTVVATNFLTAGVSTTANANYVLMAVMSMIAGAYLGWKST